MKVPVEIEIVIGSFMVNGWKIGGWSVVECRGREVWVVWLELKITREMNEGM